MPLDIQKIRDDFPILHQQVYNRQLVYLDNAASTQKPRQVIQAITDYYEKYNCNIHRGVHYLSQKATEAYELTRKEVQRFINAPSSNEIIFTRGTTESINLVASSFGKRYISKDDEIIITIAEHHSNFVPWQNLCHEKGAKLRFININEKGELEIESLPSLIKDKTRLIAITHVSNVLGTINPVKEITRLAHQHNIPVLVDGAQSISHIGADVHDIDCDFYCFSGHKMYAPMGIGVLFGKAKLLEEMPPYHFGGEMIKEVYKEYSTYNELPFKFEAGTPNVEGVFGLLAAINYMERIGLGNIAAYEHELLQYATSKLSTIDVFRIFGTSPMKTSVLSFLIGDIHHYDMGIIIDKLGIAVRTGHHCAMPLMDFLGVPGLVRASFAFYNTFEEVDRLVEAVIRAKEMLS